MRKVSEIQCNSAGKLLLTFVLIVIVLISTKSNWGLLRQMSHVTRERVGKWSRGDNKAAEDSQVVVDNGDKDVDF